MQTSSIGGGAAADPGASGQIAMLQQQLARVMKQIRDLSKSNLSPKERMQMQELLQMQAQMIMQQIAQLQAKGGKASAAHSANSEADQEARQQLQRMLSSSQVNMPTASAAPTGTAGGVSTFA